MKRGRVCVGFMGYRVLVVPSGKLPAFLVGNVRKGPKRAVNRSSVSLAAASAAAAAIAAPLPTDSGSNFEVVSLSRMRQPSLVSMPSTVSICTGESSCASSDALERAEVSRGITPTQEDARSVTFDASQIVI